MSYVDSPSPSDFALVRAQWQRILFDTPNRADLASCVPAWSCRTIRVRVHRNHGFEAVSSGATAYAAWNGLRFDWMIGGYDDSLTFDLNEDADVELIWIDTDRLRNAIGDELGTWLASRVFALRSLTVNPILVLAWPLTHAERDHVAEADVPAAHVASLETIEQRLADAWLDGRTASLSGTRLSNRACLEVARALACCWLPAVACPPLKAVAVDLDGTLYEGVLGEDGPTGIALLQGHVALQQRLIELRAKGFLLAIVSRNDLRDVHDLFAQRDDFPLRLEDFSAIDANWDDKGEALARVASELHISTDAMIFVDDNPGDLAAVASVSAARTVHADGDGRRTAAALMHVAGVFRWRASAEDALRANDLRVSAVRDAASAGVDPDEYLRSLEVSIDYHVGSREHLRRAAELVAKTNQFNLSLRRMNEAEIARRLNERASNVIAIRLADRLSDSGVVAVLVGTRSGDTLQVEEICVSCRALGRRLEDVMLTGALRLMGGDDPPAMVAFLPRAGPRNLPARQWLERYAAARLDDTVDCVRMRFDTIATKPMSAAIRTRTWQ